jgi:hypothetical protein
MKNIEEILRKYNCKIVDGKILNKNGNDTKIALKSFLELAKETESLRPRNLAEVKDQLFKVFEESVKERSDI